MAEDEDVVTAPVVAMGLLEEVQAEEVPSHPVEEVTVVVAADTVVAATVVEEIAVVAIAEEEIEAAIVEVAIGAVEAVTEVAAAVDGLPPKSTPLPLEEFPPPMVR